MFNNYKWYDWLGTAATFGGYSAFKGLADGIYDLSKKANNQEFSSALARMNDANVSRQEAFNANQAQLQREFEERMSNSAVQRQVADIKASGLNPWLALNGGGVNGASTPAAAAATSNSAFASNYLQSSMYNGFMKAVVSLASSAMSLMGSVAKAAAAA